jgi:hypothetical protein
MSTRGLKVRPPVGSRERGLPVTDAQVTALRRRAMALHDGIMVNYCRDALGHGRGRAEGRRQCAWAIHGREKGKAS